PLLRAVRWEAGFLASPGEFNEAVDAIESIETAVQLSLRQVLLCVVSLTDGPGFPPGLSETLRMLPLWLPSQITIKEAAPAVWPLTWEHLERFGPKLRSIQDRYLQDVRNLESGKPSRDLNYSARSVEALMS